LGAQGVRWGVGVVTPAGLSEDGTPNAVGAVDFIMTQTKNGAYMGQFTSEQLAYFYGFPIWVVISWGIATRRSAIQPWEGLRSIGPRPIKETTA